MPRGTPLTPAQVETIVRVYAATGNASEAARQAGCETSSATRKLNQLRAQRRSELHARATERGIREARKGLRASEKLLRALLEATEDPAALGLEPRDIAALINARSQNAKVMLAVAGRIEAHAAAKLERAKLKAEIAKLAATADEGGDVTVVVRVAGG